MSRRDEFFYENVHVRRRRLPHWDATEGIYSVTFREADSLPNHVIEELRAEAREVRRALERRGIRITPEKEISIRAMMMDRVEQELDRGFGACHLREVGSIVESALKYFDTSRYSLLAWCVMPNHVHVVFKLGSSFQLADILHSWKSYTSKEAKKIVAVKGSFWQRDYYDRLILSVEQLRNSVGYVVANPGRARLRDWPWVGTNDALIARELS